MDGTLVSIAYADGRRLDYTGLVTPPGNGQEGSRYLIESIRDEAGRKISFKYVNGDEKYSLIQSVTDPAGVVLPMSYDAAGNLTAIAYADQTRRQFLYEDATQAHLLTGVLDESGSRLGSYQYDGAGRAIGSQTGSLPGWTVRWEAPPDVQPLEYYDPVLDVVVRKAFQVVPTQAFVTAPDGRESVWNGRVVGRSALVGSRSQPAGAGCAASTSSSSFDAAGNVTQTDDFNGHRRCMGYSPGRNLESWRVEGLASTLACSSVGGGTVPDGARKISSRWHPDWRILTGAAEPRRITTWVYNGQPDPFNGDAVASCAPANALLPDGKPIVVLCKRVEQATTDESGTQGFDAPLQTGVAARSTSWTYNATGQVLTETDPRGLVVVTHDYYSDTTADHTVGDLKSSTNALGHKTHYLRYNAYGQPLEVLDPNGVSTSYTYDARQRLTSLTTPAGSTTYEYWPTGLLHRTAQPDGSVLSYAYDDAHRLVAVADAAGNRIEYTLDANGNRIKEEAKDPQGTLKRTMGRVFDALGRAQQIVGRE